MADYSPDKHCGGQKANRPKGELCTRPKGWGTEHPGIGRCKFHGGSTPNHNIAAQKELARQACAQLGVPVQINPAEALLASLWEAWGNVEFYRQLVQELPTHPGDDEYIPGGEDLGEPEDDGATEGKWVRGEPGIYGRTYHVSGLPTGEAKRHILLQMYDDERDRAVAIATKAATLGIEERRLRLIEQDATRIWQAQVDALRRLGLENRIDEFRNAFISALRPHVDVVPAALSAAA